MKTNEIHIGGRKKILPQNVVLLEADQNYTRLYMIDGDQLLVATTLKILENRFSNHQNFFRSHRSHVLNLNHLLKYDELSKQIIMKNQKVVVLSRRRTRNFEIKYHKL